MNRVGGARLVEGCGLRPGLGWDRWGAIRVGVGVRYWACMVPAGWGVMGVIGDGGWVIDSIVAVMRLATSVSMTRMI